MSDGTAIVEAEETSGTQHQAAESLRLGRWLFIAQSMMDYAHLSWARKFDGDERFVVLKKADEVPDALSAAQNRDSELDRLLI